MTVLAHSQQISYGLADYTVIRRGNRQVIIMRQLVNLTFVLWWLFALDGWLSAARLQWVIFDKAIQETVYIWSNWAGIIGNSLLYGLGVST